MPLSRSQQMARIRGADTTPERLLARAMRRCGLRPRMQHRAESVRVDLAFPRARLAVFVDGCFWHGCPRHYAAPGSNRAFWRGKLRDNFARDRRQTLALEAAGWRVVRLWEHEVLVDTAVVAARLAAIANGARWRRRNDLRVVRAVPASPLGQGVRRERRWLEPLRGGRFRCVVRRRTTNKARMHERRAVAEVAGTRVGRRAGAVGKRRRG